MICFEGHNVLSFHGDKTLHLLFVCYLLKQVFLMVKPFVLNSINTSLANN